MDPECIEELSYKLENINSTINHFNQQISILITRQRLLIEEIQARATINTPGAYLGDSTPNSPDQDSGGDNLEEPDSDRKERACSPAQCPAPPLEPPQGPSGTLMGSS